MFGGSNQTLMLGNPRIQPKTVYTPQQTRSAMSQVQGAHRVGADPNVATKPFSRPGLGQSEGTFAAALPSMVGSRVAGNQAGSNLYLDDLVANQNQLLTGSIARDREMRGMGGLALQMYGIDQNRDLQQIGNELTFFNRLMAGAY